MDNTAATFQYFENVNDVFFTRENTLNDFMMFFAISSSKIARVAVIRRITTVIWHMLTHEEAYSVGGPPPRLRRESPTARSEAA